MSRLIGLAAVVALSVGAIGIAQGSTHPSDSAATAAKKKGKKPKRRGLDVEYKTEQIENTNEGGSSDVEFSTYSKLIGKPFGAFKPHMIEWRDLFWKIPGQVPRIDASATVQVNFTASIRGKVKSQDGTFKGFWSYSQDSGGNILSPIAGVITSGTGKFKGAGGRFDVVGLHRTGTELERQAGRWTGFIRY
jgi:hypothetical protein